MKKGIIIYKSKYGATEKYANWLSKETNFDCIINKSIDINKILQYDIIIFAGGIYASGIAGLTFLKKNFAHFANKKIAVLCVGASPFEEKAFEEIYKHNFNGSLNGIPCYYGRGSWDESLMSFKDKTLCKLLQKAVSKQSPDTYEPWQKALMCAVGQTCDWTDKKYLNPLIEWINSID